MQALGEVTVVDGGGQVVAGRRRAGVEADLDVDDELLAVASLVLEDAMMTPGSQPRQRQPVGAAGRGCSSSTLFLLRFRARQYRGGVMDPQPPTAGRVAKHVRRHRRPPAKTDQSRHRCATAEVARGRSLVTFNALMI